MTAYWVGVASREHVRAAVSGGFCQFNHGKAAPLKRLRPGDRIVYYSPREAMRGGETVQAFTAIGEVLTGEPYAVDLPGGRFHRRRALYADIADVPIRPLLEILSFTQGRASWGQVLRRGTFQIIAEDYSVLAKAAGIEDER